MKSIPLDLSIFTNDDTRLCSLVDMAFRLLLDDDFEPFQLSSSENLDVIRLYWMMFDVLVAQGYTADVVLSFLQNRKQYVRICVDEPSRVGVDASEIEEPNLACVDVAEIDELERKKNQFISELRKWVISWHFKAMIDELREFPNFSLADALREIRSHLAELGSAND